MQEMSDRRKFLKAAVTSSAILGFPFLCSQVEAEEKGEPADAPQPDFLALARQRMRDEIRPGVVLLIPADQKQRHVMAAALAALIGTPAKARELAQRPAPFGPRQLVSGGDAAAQRLFCQAVFVCLAVEEAQKAFPGLKPDTRAVLLGLDGKPADQLRGDLSLYQKDFAERMGRLVHGDKGERLRAVVEAQRRALGADAARQCGADLKQLDADRFAVRQAAYERLAKIAPRIPGLLEAILRDNPCLEVRRRVERLLDAVHAQAPEHEAGARLPYGVEWQAVVIPPCPGCGKGFAAPTSRLFLQFYTDPKVKPHRHHQLGGKSQQGPGQVDPKPKKER